MFWRGNSSINYWMVRVAGQWMSWTSLRGPWLLCRHNLEVLMTREVESESLERKSAEKTYDQNQLRMGLSENWITRNKWFIIIFLIALDYGSSHDPPWPGQLISPAAYHHALLETNERPGLPADHPFGRSSSGHLTVSLTSSFSKNTPVKLKM